MKLLYIALKAEQMKMKHSRIFWISILVFAFIPAMMSGMMVIARSPELVAKLGLVGTKATLFATADWNGYLALMLQMLAALGYIGFCFATSWVFGREFIDHTLKDMLALPIDRNTQVLAKFIVTIIWSLILSFVLFGVGTAMGFVIDLPGANIVLLNTFMVKFLVTSALTLVLITPAAWISCYSQGIIAPLGFVILTLILAQLVSIVGLGFVFPWAIPGLTTIPTGTPGTQLYPVSFVILFITGITGLWATFRWWNIADHK